MKRQTSSRFSMSMRYRPLRSEKNGYTKQMRQRSFRILSQLEMVQFGLPAVPETYGLNQAGRRLHYTKRTFKTSSLETLLITRCSSLMISYRMPYPYEVRVCWQNGSRKWLTTPMGCQDSKLLMSLNSGCPLRP